MTRKLRPRDPVATMPVTVTQLTCMPILGIDARRFLDFVASSKVPHAKIGRLRVVDVVVMREHLARASSVAADAPGDQVDDDDLDEDDAAPETPDGVLARIGRRRTA
jgi:hypothetical protein